MNLKSNKLLIIVAVVFAAVVLFLVFGGMSHIEDTNGPDDYSLVTITDEDILGNSHSSTFTMHRELSFGTHTTHTVGKFSGVYDLESRDVLFSTGMTITVDRLILNEGNLRLLVIMDGAIVHEFHPSDAIQTYTISEPEGVISLRIAGESANFELEYSIN